MSCCGDRRLALTTSMTRQSPPNPTPPMQPSSTSVEYRGDSSLVVRGQVTGTTYLFGPRGAALLVDTRDVAALLRSGAFERSG